MPALIVCSLPEAVLTIFWLTPIPAAYFLPHHPEPEQTPP